MGEEDEQAEGDAAEFPQVVSSESAVRRRVSQIASDSHTWNKRRADGTRHSLGP